MYLKDFFTLERSFAQDQAISQKVFSKKSEVTKGKKKLLLGACLCIVCSFTFSQFFTIIL